MAERRMMSKKVIHSDVFMDLPATSKNLYFYLMIEADDDGFVNSPKRIQRMIGATDDDAKILLAKKFIISFESGVIVIKHWRVHNYIQRDRYKETSYTKEMAQIIVKDNNVYSLDTTCIHSGRLGKDRLGKDRLGKVSLVEDSKESMSKTSFDFLACWNNMASECGISKIQSITKSRKAKLATRYKDIKDFEDTFVKACGMITESDFLQGINNQGWKITFDWLVYNDTSIKKVVEGNYKNTQKHTKEAPIGSLEWERQQMIKKSQDTIDAEFV